MVTLSSDKSWVKEALEKINEASEISIDGGALGEEWYCLQSYRNDISGSITE